MHDVSNSAAHTSSPARPPLSASAPQSRPLSASGAALLSDMGTMTKYSKELEDKSRVATARGSNLRVHFKNSRETAKAIKGMSLAKAKSYLEEVMEHKRCIVFRRFCGGVGRTPLAKNEGSTNGQVSSCCIFRSGRPGPGEAVLLLCSASGRGQPVTAQQRSNRTCPAALKHPDSSWSQNRVRFAGPLPQEVV